jgi:histone H3/H4
MASTSKDLIIALSMSFISNLASKANTICSNHNKKTIVAEHVFEAMHEAKQTYLLGPIFDSQNYSKLSYAKAKEIAM